MPMGNKSSRFVVSHCDCAKIANPEPCTYGQWTLEMTQIFISVISFNVPWKDLLNDLKEMVNFYLSTPFSSLLDITR